MWMGDFNGWGYDKSFQNKGTRIPHTDIWILKASFPKDARLDYKIVVNDANWILDPDNTHQQWSGVGGGSPNSELRMPMWKAEPIAEAIAGIPHGTVRKDVLINSKQLNYQVTYSVYTPPSYKPGDPQSYPVIYVTDGYEYMHENMGNMITILDNLVYQKKIRPVIAVFVDHREPVNRSNNKRMQELAMNEHYLNFFTQELIPAVETRYAISKKPGDRAILGTSMGGLTAAYFSFSKPDVFGLAGIQSPAFWFRPEIYTFCDNPDTPPVKTFMTTGLVNDTREGAEKMKTILDKNTCTFQYKEVNQGHSWGNWRDLIDDILIYFFAAN
jgi:enterochelin esterase family protein